MGACGGVGNKYLSVCTYCHVGCVFVRELMCRMCVAGPSVNMYNVLFVLPVLVLHVRICA